jgi:hypothetical protein
MGQSTRITKSKKKRYNVSVSQIMVVFEYVYWCLHTKEIKFFKRLKPSKEWDDGQQHSSEVQTGYQTYLSVYDRRRL